MGTLLGRYATSTGAELEVDEETACIYAVMRLAQHLPNGGKPRVVILGPLSAKGQQFLIAVRDFDSANFAGWSVASRDFPVYPGLREVSK